MEQRQRLRSAAARRILHEVEESESTVDDVETLATWERRAQEVVCGWEGLLLNYRLYIEL